MKQINGAGNLVILRDPSRPRRFGLRAGRPPCMSAVWRDCSADTAYYVFADGQVYRFDALASADARTTILQPVIGTAWNNSVRRPVPAAGTYLANATIAGTATQIYSYPPYPGTDPGPCPTVDPLFSLFSPTALSNPYGPGQPVTNYDTSGVPVVWDWSGTTPSPAVNGTWTLTGQTVISPVTGTCVFGGSLVNSAHTNMTLACSTTSGGIRFIFGNNAGLQPISATLPVTAGDTVQLFVTIQIFAFAGSGVVDSFHWTLKS